MENLKILQVVGFKNSGKTTLLSRLITLAVQRGKKVSTIKHHGHGGELEMPSAEADSSQFFEKGAASSLVFGNGVVQLHLQKQQENLEAFIDISRLAHPDILLIEGFKKADFPKIVLVRSPADWNELEQLSNIQLIITHEGIKLDGARSVQLNNESEIDEFFIQWMAGE